MTIPARAITGEAERVGVLSRAAMDEIDRRHLQGGSITGLASGFRDLDDMTGGFPPGTMIIIAARPSMGKTAFAMNIAQHVAAETPTAFFSLEMSKSALTHRLLSAHSGVDGWRIQRN